MEPVSTPASTPAGDSAGPGVRAGWLSSPVFGLGLSAFGRTPRIRFLIRLAELGVGVGFVLIVLSPDSPKYAAGMIAALVSGLAWLTWTLCETEPRRSLTALSVLSAAGGVCAAAHSTGLLFVFIAIGATAFSFPPVYVAAVFVPAIVGFLVTNLAADTFPGHLGSLAAIGLLGASLGLARRGLRERSHEATLLATAERRAALADREAQLAAERNRLGREIHDVLAHTLGAVSIQLTALDSRLDADDPPAALRARLRNLHALVGDGLQEARDAVRALRDDRLALETQIERVCNLRRAALTVEGRSRPLPAETALALYRVVQESLTNAAKHAPGAAVAVTLTYGEDEVRVAVENRPPAAADPLAETGGGNGLAGMRTRVELVGGHCAAGPRGDGGWRVTATVPLDEALAGPRREQL